LRIFSLILRGMIGSVQIPAVAPLLHPSTTPLPKTLNTNPTHRPMRLGLMLNLSQTKGRQLLRGIHAALEGWPAPFKA
jgi:hypothetical protein